MLSQKNIIFREEFKLNLKQKLQLQVTVFLLDVYSLNCNLIDVVLLQQTYYGMIFPKFRFIFIFLFLQLTFLHAVYEKMMIVYT